jgi:glutamate formiminotransferase/formiminotetrahydrofolate cyclodeaminase
MSRIIECVPNFSEGRDLQVIRRITDAIEQTGGVTLLDVDPGRATNRTVVTFAGEPEPVLEAAFNAIKTAGEYIDMRRHEGEHPRFGAADVCPLVPIANITMEETVSYARELAERVGEKLRIPVYCYEQAALSEERRNLAAVRAGEYGGLEQKLKTPEGRPDFGPADFNPRTGAVAVGARSPLIAWNVNLNTRSVDKANQVAFDVREKGRVKRENGRVVRDGEGRPVRIPGRLRCVKGIGWYIEEYGICQVSMNLTDTGVTPLYTVFDEVCARAREHGMRVTGSEIVGLVPLADLVKAGRHFLKKQNRSTGVPDSELVRMAVKTMGLDELASFKPDKKIIEYALGLRAPGRLAGMTAASLIDEVASDTPAPGGGSVAAAAGALGAALGTMVANLSAHRKGREQRYEEFSAWAEKGRACIDSLRGLMDEDTRAFNGIMQALRLPRRTEAEKTDRNEQITRAVEYATEIPLEVMRSGLQAMELVAAMAREGLPASATDAGVSALCIMAAVAGAHLNVRVNAKELKDGENKTSVLAEARQLEERAAAIRDEIRGIVEEKLGSA